MMFLLSAFWIQSSESVSSAPPRIAFLEISWCGAMDSASSPAQIGPQTCGMQNKMSITHKIQDTLFDTCYVLFASYYNV